MIVLGIACTVMLIADVVMVVFILKGDEMIEFWQGFVSGVISTMAFEFVVSLVFIILAVKGARDRDGQ